MIIVSTHVHLFLGGCTNSGTGLVRILLDKHPLISVLPQEGPKLTRLLPDDDRCHLPRRLFGLYPDIYHLTENHLSDYNFNNILRDWEPHWDTNKPYLFEKCPANATRMRLLKAAFPDAFFFGLVRNPYAVCEGIHRRRQHPVALCAKHWLIANQTMLNDTLNFKRFLLLRYEDLTENTNHTLTKIFNFIGLDSRLSIDPSEIIERHNITDKPQPIKNLNPLSIANLSNEDINDISKIAWPFAHAFGYKPINKT